MFTADTQHLPDKNYFSTAIKNFTDGILLTTIRQNFYQIALQTY